MHNSHQPGDVDFVKFPAVAGATYVMRTSDLGGRLDNDTTLTLYGTDGATQLAYNDDDPVAEPGASRIEWQAPAAGTYFLRVAQFNPQIGGCALTYRLEVRRGAPLLTPEVFLPIVTR
jgi:hypothetical protein